MLAAQYLLPIAHEITVDLFAGGGGASTGIEMATGRYVDIAVNHDPDAISMHAANHPQTTHYLSDIWEVDPIEVTEGQHVGLLHASPDCTHHSQARGGQPRNQKRRSLSWVALRWLGKLLKRGKGPRVFTLENVEQILQWSPLIAKRCKLTGRVIRLDGTVAPKGEHTPRDQQFLVPDPRHVGRNWRHFVNELRRMGGDVQWRKIIAANFNTPTTRERLILVCRFDGQPIVWPEATHAKNPTKGKKRWRAAAECIDFSLECPSIFERQRPLADATMKRIAKGIRKYVLDSADPFIVAIGQTGGNGDRVRSKEEPLPVVVSKAEQCLVTPTLVQTGYGERAGQEPRALDLQKPLGVVMAEGVKHAVVAPTLVHYNADKRESDVRASDMRDPAKTQTTENRHALVASVLVQAGHGEGKPGAPRWSHGANDIKGAIGTVTASGGGQALASAVLVGVGGRAGQSEPRRADEPGYTTTSKADAGLAVAYLAQQNGGFNTNPGHEAGSPVSSITATGSQQQLVAAVLSHAYTSNTCGGEGDVRKPAKTIMTGGHHSLVECTLSEEDEAGALRVAAFLMKYYGEGGQDGDARDPAATITTKDRLALVTVTIKGTPYVIVDIGLRMLQPKELYAAQGFPANYIIDRGHDGRKFSKSAQVRMCGNSVCPEVMAAIIRANYADQAEERAAA